jgi:hypothetical protein
MKTPLRFSWLCLPRAQMGIPMGIVLQSRGSSSIREKIYGSVFHAMSSPDLERAQW